jgi:DNA (cytosine-5)-methyltransferase 1
VSKLRVLSLFAGIGGFDLGLERTGGFETVAFCEIDPFCRRVLAKHWPEVPCYHDVRELTAERLAADGIAVDAICGGFPCQDLSKAGRGAGLEGERSGLWSEYARLIRELRPAYVIVENVSALLGRGLGRVLGDLAEIGYDAEWHCIPAGAVGAPHIRDRLWLVAYPNGCVHAGELVGRADSRTPATGESGDAGEREASYGQRLRHELGASCSPLADANPAGRPHISWGATLAERGWIGTIGDTSRWEAEPAVGRVVDGLSRLLDRWRKRSVEGFGNAVVPQIPELIGRAILAAIAGETGTAGTTEIGPARRVSTRAEGIAQKRDAA